MIYVNIARLKTHISGMNYGKASTDHRTHVMIKIRVPTPSLVRRRPTELPMYPGTAVIFLVHADLLGRMLNVLPPTLDIAQYQQLKQETLRSFPYVKSSDVR